MKRLFTFVLCAVLALALCAPAAAFSDVAEGMWYTKAVNYCEANGLMNGFPDGTFRPTASVTRAQLVTTLWRCAGEPETEGDQPENGSASGFTDVADSAWYAPAVAWAVAAGITDGTGQGLFSPDRPVTREMLATFFYRYAGTPEAEADDFADQAEIAGWAQTGTIWAKASGLMQGVGNNVFDPKTEASRAVLAQTLMNYIAWTEKFALADGCAPVDVAKGEDGALYITDSFHKAIWMVTYDGSTRVAGMETAKDINGVPTGGYLDGEAGIAMFQSPWGIAPFLGGWAISDPENNAVRVLRDGAVATANGIDFNYPTGLAADDEGRLYVANTHAGEILLVTPEGEATAVLSGLDSPMGLCWQGGALYIAETGARKILKLEGGTLTVVAGSGKEGSEDGPAKTASFVAPEGVAVAEDGTLYVTDAVGATVRRVKDGVVTTLLYQKGSKLLEPWPVAPVGVLVDGGTLYVCDRYAGKILVMTIE